MRIISERKGFQADHSSTSYEFLAVKKLSAEAKKAVGELSSRARPTDTRVSFVYEREGYDLPGGWEPLMERHYDVMSSESYDWWTLAMAFEADAKLVETLEAYAFRGDDDQGVDVEAKDGRVVVTLYCRLQPEFSSVDSFLKLLVENRKLLMQGDCRLLYGVWEQYGADDDDDDAPPDTDMAGTPKAAQRLLDMMTSD